MAEPETSIAQKPPEAQGHTLTPSRVRDIAKKCLFAESEIVNGNLPPERLVIGDAIVRKYGFDRDRIEIHKPEIREMLDELPEVFKEGMSFLNACYDKHGYHWGEHIDMGTLFALGQAAGMVESCLPREMWSLLPGGMPYYRVLEVKP